MIINVVRNTKYCNYNDGIKRNTGRPQTNGLGEYLGKAR